MKFGPAYLLLGLLGLSTVAQSATRPNFTGTWLLDKTRSKLQVPVPDSSMFVITHSDPSFTLSRTHVVKGTPDTFSISLTTDGKEVALSEPGETSYNLCRWRGEHLVFQSRIVRGTREATNAVTYSISSDHNVLTAQERFIGPRLRYHNTWVFTRQ